MTIARVRRPACAVAALLALSFRPDVALAQACDTGLDADCDLDGWSVDEGDCDDGDAAINPGAREDCTDQLDNNCDGFFNEACDREVYNGSIGGGGGCTQENSLGNSGTSSGTTAALLLPFLGFGIRRSRRSEAGR